MLLVPPDVFLSGNVSLIPVIVELSISSSGIVHLELIYDPIVKILIKLEANSILFPLAVPIFDRKLESVKFLFASKLLLN
jgi:hypothetical protein